MVAGSIPVVHYSPSVVRQKEGSNPYPTVTTGSIPVVHYPSVVRLIFGVVRLIFSTLLDQLVKSQLLYLDMQRT